jgi:hypothetical protein
MPCRPSYRQPSTRGRWLRFSGSVAATNSWYCAVGHDVNLCRGCAIKWLLQSSEIAMIAEDYTRVVVFNNLAFAVSCTYTLVFHICGHV